jgi:hypothetical protein
MGRALLQNPNAGCDVLRTYLETEPDAMTRDPEQTREKVKKRMEADCS